MVPDELRRRVAESRALQGLPPVIEDLAVIERVALAFRLIEPEPSDPATPREIVRFGAAGSPPPRYNASFPASLRR